MALHSICQPGKPRPQGLSHAISRPGSRRLPQRKIFGIAPVRYHAFAHTRQHVLKLVAGELAIVWEAFDVKIDIAIDLICDALCLQALR